MALATYIALLRGINVTGKNKIAMADLRALAEGLGWRGAQTYIQSGNLIFQADGAAAELEEALEHGIAERFALKIPVVVRAGAAWPAYAAACPFPEEAEREPNRLMLTLSKAQPKADAAERLQERAAAGEQVRLVGDALWVFFPGGAGTSKLSPALFDRLVGSPATARNYRTVVKLGEMAGALA